jgi:hypothetical protein
VVGIGIDSLKESLVTEESSFLFAGWIVPKGEQVKWLLNYADYQTELVLNVDRPDVIEYFRGQDILVDLKCGFHEEVLLEGLKSIVLSINGLEYEVFTVIDAQINLDKLNNTAVTWLNMHEKNVDNKNLQRVKTEELLGTFEILSKKEFLSLYMSEFNEKESVEDLFSELADPNWPMNIFEVIVNTKTCTQNGFFSSDQVKACFSINVVDFNFIYFANSKESFYLVQHCANVSVIFPTLFRVVSLSEVNHWVNESLNKVPTLFNYIINDYSLYSSLLSGSGKGHFLGFNVTQSRPYHYFYDYVYGLDSLLKNNDAQTAEIKVFGVKGFDFIDFSLVNSKAEYVSYDEAALNKLLIRQAGYTVMPCIQHCKSSYDKKLLRLSSNLVSASNRYCSNASVISAESPDLTMWIGVSNEKRSWVEQVDGFSKIIEELSKKFKSVVVVVDGRTFPQNPRQADIANKQREDLLFNTLVNKNPAVKFVNMIGMQAIEKIYLAQKIDFFISSYATDSIYPSAICKKPGVVYVAPSIGDQKKLHIHHRILEVPSDKVKDVLSSDGVKKSWHETSISIDWRDIYKCVLLLIDKYEIRK